MYENADQFTKDEQQKETSTLRLAEVTRLNGGAPRLTFYGEDTESQKDYKFLSTYSPSVGDTVCVGRINESWLIFGKVTNAHEKPEAADIWYLKNPYGGSVGLLKYSDSSRYTFRFEDGSGLMDVGSPSKKCGDIYATNGTIQTSDAREKEEVKDIAYKYISMLLKLAPKSYRIIAGTSGRTHIGFLAQDVEAVMNELGISSMEFAGFVKSPIYDESGENVIDYAYGLRYEEFIGIMVRILQDIVSNLGIYDHEDVEGGET